MSTSAPLPTAPDGREPQADGIVFGPAAEPHDITARAASARRRQIRTGLNWLAGVSAVLVVATYLSGMADLDCRLSAFFYNPQTGWHLSENRFWQMVYRFGPTPGLVLILGSAAGLVASFFGSRWRSLRRPMAIVFLTAIIGAGFLVNAVLKPYWGRPRPREITAFGGLWDYRAPHQPGTPGRGKSFPCGHCTMGYLFVALQAFRRRAPAAAVFGAVSGSILGTFIGIGRIAQGAHFATDVLWSLGIILMVYGTLEYLALPWAAAWLVKVRAAPTNRRSWPAAAASAAALVGLGAFLTCRPFYETYNHVVPLAAEVRELSIDAGEHLAGFQVHWSNAGTAFFRVHVQGFGWIKARLAEHTAMASEGTSTLNIYHRLRPRGLFYSRLDHRVEILLPAALEGKIVVRFAAPDHDDRGDN